MYEITVEQHFEAAHFLRGYKGKCENVHGHQYLVRVKIQTRQLNDIGLAYDFTDVKAALRSITGRFDHVLLNDIHPFDKINPSAENIARTVFEELQSKLAPGKAELTSVEAWENPQQGVSYRPD